MDTIAIAAGDGLAMTTPSWSVIVPTRNRPRQLAGCIRALAHLQPPAGGFEVIVINDGGEPPDENLSAHSSGTPTVVRIATQAHAGPAAARNTGARMAAGTWLAFTDDDCEPSSGWLLAFERALVAQPMSLAGGEVRNIVADSIFSEASQLLVAFVANWFDGESRERFFSSNNIALSRAAFLEAGGFDPGFVTSAGEDREFCDRWSAQGRASLSVRDAIVGHRHELSLRSFMRQHHSYGRAAQHFRRRRSGAGRPVRIDPRFYVASLRHAVRSQPLGRGAALAGCTLLAHTVYAAGVLRESWRTTLPVGTQRSHS